MSRINVLTKDVYNKIAAGEVVEKPASVVKELVENSIDAGATSITIEILDGGIKQIKVSDNGCGISKDDYDKVFLAHATSKVKSVEDLASIGTLGFRGEALSSIASVSKITLSSKTADDEEGYQVVCEGGEMGEISPIGATTGTYMVISDLFYNIPARKKFLRKPKLEENDITNYISRLILANPDISIKYIADNKIVYHSFGTGLYDAIYTIYGKLIVDNILEVKFERGDFKFSGYIGKPSFSKANRTYQTLIINGRYVINQTIATAINRAYENFMMKGGFPFFVLNLEIPLDKVDVNVHPNKLEVKFEDSNSLFGIVYSEILNILYNMNNTKTISSEDIEEVDKSKLKVLDNIGSNYNNIDSQENKPNNEDNEEIIEVTLTKEVEYESNKKQVEVEEFNKSLEIAKSENFNYKEPAPFKPFEYKIAQNTRPQMEDNNTQVDMDLDESGNNHSSDNLTNITNSQQESVLFNDEINVIGSLFNTYILVEKDDKMLVIDQHAGHERLLFDKFNAELESKNIAVQPLMIPYILDINYTEASFISNNIDVLTSMGIDIEAFGDSSFKISTVPLLFDNLDLDKFFDEILTNLDGKLVLSRGDSIKDYIAKKACRSAVKANDKLSKDEISQLLKQLNEDGQVLLCPHGRPIVIEVSKKEIEKWFKRIV